MPLKKLSSKSGAVHNHVGGLLVNPRACEFLELLDCDRLDLVLARFSGTKDDLKAARDALADIATRAQSLADLQAIKELWSTHEKERDRVNKNHALGEIVQMAVAIALRKHGVIAMKDWSRTCRDAT